VLQVPDAYASNVGPAIVKLRRSTDPVRQYSAGAVHLIVDWSTIGICYVTEDAPPSDTPQIVAVESQFS
jgi:hypothetical protein